MGLYKMTSKIRTISIPEEMEDYLINNPELSLSKIAQVQIKQIMENRSDLTAQLIRAQNNIVNLNGIIKEQGDKIDVLEKAKAKK